MSLLLSLTLLGCGKTPADAAISAGASGAAGGSSASGGDSAGAAAADAKTEPPPFDCVDVAEAGDMVSVAAGDFSMGCTPGDADCRDDEKPQHTVSLGAFEIDRTEVSQAAYAACVQAGVCDAPSCTWDCTRTTYPARCVERAQAVAYCTWVTKRLPTEAEWEKAARGTDGRKYPWGSGAPDCTRANLLGCGGVVDAVGARPAGASPYGALDMAGNVVEIVADWYGAKYYATSTATDPTGPATGTRYVGRGGGFKSDATWQRASSRDWYDLTDASEPLGFRCAR